MADEEVIMTPTKKGKATHIRIERKSKLNFGNGELEQRHHVGGGEHRGLVINKSSQGENEEDLGKPQVQLGFNCFLVDTKTGKHAVESRKLKFWYVDTADYLDQVTTGFNFFRELLKPENFPKDYVGFIRKCMKQMQKPEYSLARKINLEIELLDDESAPHSPDSPIAENGYGKGLTADELMGLTRHDPRPWEEIVREKLLHVLESAYPNILSVEDLVRIVDADEACVLEQLAELQRKDLIRSLESGGFVRHVLDIKTEVQEVKQMMTVSANQQPTIAIITANYCEKLAVDAMMENKTTYVKFKTGGESNAYTIGYIGEHKCVSTKLPMIGHDRSAQISSGNTTTRLLGTFQQIEHVFIVGVAGGVPHFTDYYKHPRLGDVMISDCSRTGDIYYYCDKILQEKDGTITYNTKAFRPRDGFLQNVLDTIKEQRLMRKFEPWRKYIRDGLELLATQEADYNRPPPETDRLTMVIGEGNVIEMQHPHHPEGIDERQGMPKIHYGVFGAGKRFSKADDLRLDFAGRYNVNSFDSEFDQVLEGVVGSVKESFMFIRGMSDYSDGMQKQEWQPYAALAAAAVMKSIILSFSSPYISEDELE
ncbi:uncharacterized protein LOC123559375 isoform X2 [Mercenaria mercenaria]|uniref:uncharacterized protein LOC123559375 isoform X2 n=1 Tax=Mercenaria mercenaria TaxID=6596 RepID=UPI00234EE049|nr:uncharacterized protein LOC123559375 isoform X2 [Mercenaria mercenaria]